ncbi:hypothetical protein CFP65_3460 [Kitasatospora sp. MMS16-BH015]|nr:hypothetical protein CFP65_3460 [Kitasatospora sp. MMS16-BH015]
MTQTLSTPTPAAPAPDRPAAPSLLLAGAMAPDLVQGGDPVQLVGPLPAARPHGEGPRTEGPRREGPRRKGLWEDGRDGGGQTEHLPQRRQRGHPAAHRIGVVLGALDHADHPAADRFEQHAPAEALTDPAVAEPDELTGPPDHRQPGGVRLHARRGRGGGEPVRRQLGAGGRLRRGEDRRRTDRSGLRQVEEGEVGGREVRAVGRPVRRPERDRPGLLRAEGAVHRERPTAVHHMGAGHHEPLPEVEAAPEERSRLVSEPDGRVVRRRGPEAGAASDHHPGRPRRWGRRSRSRRRRPNWCRQRQRWGRRCARWCGPS